MRRREIGDTIWTARTNKNNSYVECPDCFGKKFLTVILGDDSQVTIECDGCRDGYLGASGRIHTWEHTAEVDCSAISGIEARLDEDGGELVDYRVGGSHAYRKYTQWEVFDTKEEAKECAERMVIEETDHEAENFKRKVRGDKNWSFSVSYYRGQIRKAKKDIVRATEQLAYAKTKVKK